MKVFIFEFYGIIQDLGGGNVQYGNIFQKFKFVWNIFGTEVRRTVLRFVHHHVIRRHLEHAGWKCYGQRNGRQSASAVCRELHLALVDIVQLSALHDIEMIHDLGAYAARCKRTQRHFVLALILILALSSHFGMRTSVMAVGKHTGDSTSFRDPISKLVTSRSQHVMPQIASLHDSDHHKCSSGAGLGNRIMKILIPPLLMLLFSVSSCDASALNPQPIAIKGPFFQGWLMRTIDHVNLRSFILIIGSFSSKGSKIYDEHYIFCGVEIEDEGTFQFEEFPKSNTVTVDGSSPTKPSPFSFIKPQPLKDTNITWSARGLGSFNFNDEECSADFKIAGAHIQFSSKNRLPWSKSNMHTAGPEGFLGYTSLLPCHYFVHSVGSECEYMLKLPNRNSTATEEVNLFESSVTNDGNIENERIIPSDAINQINTTDYAGTGFTHIEGNHGTFFPSGWVWSQAITADNYASFSLTAGKFEIGVFAPVTFILFVRIGDLTKIFRTTGLDDFTYILDGVVRCVVLRAFSQSRKDMVSLTVMPKSSVTGAAFGPPLFIPTAQGFMNTPGCIETYTATADLVYSTFNGKTYKYEEENRISFPLTALEFGGNFQGTVLRSKKLFRNDESFAHQN